MQITVKQVSRRLPEFKEVCALMNTSFPKSELISLSMWRALAKRKGIDFWAIYDEGDFIGVVYVVISEKNMYVPFLAICEEDRDRGYGGLVLKWLKENYSRTLVLHIEPLDQEASNYDQRIRRAAFYNKNGITDTGYRFKFLGVPFDVYASDADWFDISTHRKLMEWFSFHLIKFDFHTDEK